MITTLYNPAVEAKGVEKGKLEVAKKLLENGMDIETVVKMTELPEEKIRAIEQEESSL